MTALDLIGDVHGCHEELKELLARLGYDDARPPAGRRALFLGDLVDRGPAAPEVCALVLDMVERGDAICLRGNHEHQLLLHLAGEFPLAWGLEETMEQFARRPPEELERFRAFAAALPYQLVLDEGRLVVAHAGCPEEYQGVDSPEARQFALYAHPTGTRRIDWAADYRGEARVVHGHTPVTELRWVNRTLNLDTGCVYGGALSALRYPELELASVPARRAYYG